MTVPTSRGIKNRTKVSCHISAGIQLMFHALSQSDRADFILLSSSMSDQQQLMFRGLGEEEAFIISFGRLICEMCSEQPDGVDPDDFYQKCRINSFRVGDASNSLRSMMLDIRSNLKFIQDKCEHLGYDSTIDDLSSSLLDRMHTYFWQGISTTQIRGSRIVQKEDGHRWKITRLKEPKEKPCSCPIPIPVVGYHSLVTSLHSVISSEQKVSGYKWDAIPDYIEEEVKIDSKEYFNTNGGDLYLNPELLLDSMSSNSTTSSDESSSSEDCSSSGSSTSSSSASNDEELDMMRDWVTKRVIRPLSLPKIMLLQLLRFDYEGTRVRKINAGMNIPYTFNLTGLIESELCCEECCKYHLSGAVMYKADESNSDENEDDVGHYFSFMKEEDEDHNRRSHEWDVWKKIDDDKVSTFLVTDNESNYIETGMKVVKERVFLGVLGGKTKKKDTFATILLYKSKCRCTLS